MIIISHRGNLTGPKPDQENNPEYIDSAIERGFDVEVDVWWENGVWLGHDGPEHKVSQDWLKSRATRLWVHCKNLDAAYHLAKDFRCFCSNVDPYCYMSQGHIWVNDVAIRPPENCVVPLLKMQDIESYKFKSSAFAICTDYPVELI